MQLVFKSIHICGVSEVFDPKGEPWTSTVRNALSINALQTEVVNVSPTFICASTDGLESVAIRQRDAFPFPPFFNPLAEYMEETAEPERDDEYIMAFLSSDRLNQRTDDDKTLLMCRYEL